MAVSAVVTGCSGVASTAQSSTGQSQSAPSATNGAETDVASASGETCDSKNLSVSLGLGKPTGGTAVFGLLEFENIGPTACTLSGWPAVQLRSPSGAVINVAQNDSDGLSPVEAVVTVQPKATAYAYLRYSSPPCQHLDLNGVTQTGASSASSDYVFVVTPGDGAEPVSVPNPSLYLCTDAAFQRMSVWRFMSSVQRLDLP